MSPPVPPLADVSEHRVVTTKPQVDISRHALVAMITEKCIAITPSIKVQLIRLDLTRFYPVRRLSVRVWAVFSTRLTRVKFRSTASVPNGKLLQLSRPIHLSKVYMATLYKVFHICSCKVGDSPNMCSLKLWFIQTSLQWGHNGRDGVSNHQPHHCLLNRLFRHRSKETSKLRVTGLCAWNSPVTGEFPAQMGSNAENVSIWWRHHDGVKPWASYITDRNPGQAGNQLTVSKHVLETKSLFFNSSFSVIHS